MLHSLVASRRNSHSAFLITPTGRVSYRNFCAEVELLAGALQRHFPEPRAFALEAESGPLSFGRFLALLLAGHVAHLCPNYQFADSAYRTYLAAETQTNFLFWPLPEAVDSLSKPAANILHPLIQDILPGGSGLFLIRTSGSSGKKFKYILHSPEKFFEKYAKVGASFQRTLAFSPFESVAGIETFLECFFHGRELVCLDTRPNPRSVAQALAEHQVDYFQTTPSFLALLLLSKQIQRPALKALQKIAYGSEPASLRPLQTIAELLPEIQFKHTYGMSELGILDTHTPPANPSAFLPTAHNPWRVRDGLLEVQSLSRMLGYLNYPTPHEEWFPTGDKAVEEGGHLRVLGRSDDTLNVAGRKFFPSELEDILLDLENVADVTVRKLPNELVGDAIQAEIVLLQSEDEGKFRIRLREFSEKRLPYYMHPHKVNIVLESTSGARFKKVRNQ